MLGVAVPLPFVNSFCEFFFYRSFLDLLMVVAILANLN